VVGPGVQILKKCEECDEWSSTNGVVWRKQEVVLTARSTAVIQVVVEDVST
jgi:hypothetical protein